MPPPQVHAADRDSPRAPSPEMDFDPGHIFEDEGAAAAMPPLAAALQPPTAAFHFSGSEQPPPLRLPAEDAQPAAKRVRGARWGVPMGRGAAAGQGEAAPAPAVPIQAAAEAPQRAAPPAGPPLPQLQPRSAPAWDSLPGPPAQQQQLQRQEPPQPPSEGMRRAQEIAARLVASHGQEPSAPPPPQPPGGPVTNSSNGSAAAAPLHASLPPPPASAPNQAHVQRPPLELSSRSFSSSSSGYQGMMIPGLQERPPWPPAPAAIMPPSPPADAGSLLLKLLAPEAAAAQERPRTGAQSGSSGPAGAPAQNGGRAYSPTHARASPAPPAAPLPQPPPPAQVMSWGAVTDKSLLHVQCRV